MREYRKLQNELLSFHKSGNLIKIVDTKSYKSLKSARDSYSKTLKSLNLPIKLMRIHERLYLLSVSHE